MIKATVSLDISEMADTFIKFKERYYNISGTENKTDELYLEMLHNQNILAPIKLIKMEDIKEGDDVFKR